MKPFKLLVFNIFVLVSFCISAQALKTDAGLTTLVNQALENYPRIKEQQQAVLLAENRRQITRSQYLPNVSGDASYTYVNPIPEAVFATPAGETSIQFQPQNNYNTAISANWIVYDFGRTQANLLRNQLEIESAKNNIEGIKNTLAYQVAMLYYGIVYLQKAIEVQKSQLNLLTENQQVIANRIKNGDEIDFNLISTQVRYKNTEIRLIDLQNQLEKQYIFLGNLTGKDVKNQIGPDVAFTWNLQEISAENAFAKAQENNWDLKILKDREKIAQQEIAISGRSFYPTLGLLGSVGFKNGIQPDINQFRFNTTLGARLSIPIYNGNRLKIQQNIASTTFQLNKYTTENQTLTLKTNIEQAIANLKAVEQKLPLSDAQVQQAEYAVKLAETR
ncbi:MAG: TolC family protein, partial [Verrucomicrobia bacterium]|nr:TolC family protein [Cytophagales bacterium]